MSVNVTFAGRLHRAALLDAVAAIEPLVRATEVAARWTAESALPGWSVGGLARHLVSQPECAVEFLGLEVPAGSRALDLLAYADTLDWIDASVDAPENVSIRQDFDEMAQAGPRESIAAMEAGLARLPAAIADSGPLTFVPWQQVALATDDFLAMRMLEIVVHADDLAVSVDLPTPAFPDSVIYPVTELLGGLALRRHGQHAVVRALARAERGGPISAL